jgi:hypothetical protein
MIVRPGEKRQARLLSRGDLRTPLPLSIRTHDAILTRAALTVAKSCRCFERFRKNAGWTRWFWSTDARTGTRTRCSGGESRRLPEGEKRPDKLS